MRSIQAKIILVLVSIILIMISVITSVIVVNFSFWNRFQKINENIIYEKDLKENVWILLEEGYAGFNTGDYSKYDSIVSKINATQATLDVLMADPNINQETQLSYRSVRNSLNIVMDSVEKIKLSSVKEGSVEGVSVIFQDSVEKFEFVKQNITNLLILETENLASINKTIEKEQNVMVSSIIIITGLIIVLLLLFSIVFSRKITSPIVSLSLVAKKISEGDMTVKIDQTLMDSRDEIGTLSKSFNLMLVKLKEKILAFENTNKELDLKVKEVSDSNLESENSKKAVINLLEDIQNEKNKVEEIVIERTKELSSEKARLLASINSLSFGFIIADINHKVILKNDAIIKLFGLKETDELSIDHISKFLGSHLDIKRQIELCMKDKKLCEIKEIPFDSKFFFGTIAPILTPENNQIIGYVFLLEDITEARAIDKTKTEFVSLASHQLRTPLSTINWYTELLLSGDAGKLNPEQTEFLEDIITSSKRMSSLVGTLLNVSRIELGTFAINPEKTDLCEIVKDEVEDLKVQFEDKKIEFEMLLNLNPAIVFVDPKLMSIVVQNLLTNAIKYNPSGGKVTLSVDKKESTEEVVLTVTDTGYGIPKENQDKIFTKMYRADNAVAIDAEGNGIGLYMVKSILETSGCTISFESPIKGKDNGSAFYVNIPKEGMKHVWAKKRLGDVIS